MSIDARPYAMLCVYLVIVIAQYLDPATLSSETTRVSVQLVYIGTSYMLLLVRSLDSLGG